MFQHTGTGMRGNESMQTLRCDITCLLHTRTYPAATRKGVADLCTYQLQCTCKCMCIPALRFSRHARSYNNKAVKQDYHDDDKMNTLAFVNCLPVKFLTLIR